MKKRIVNFMLCFCFLCMSASCMACSTKTPVSKNIQESTDSSRTDVDTDNGNEEKLFQKENKKNMGISEVSRSRKNTEKNKEEELQKINGVQLSTDNALELIEEKYGKNGSRDEHTGDEKSYVYEDIQEVDGKTYFNYRYSWIIYDEDGNADHISQVGNIFVSTDGSEIMFAEKTEDGWNLYSPDNEVACFFIMENEGKKESTSTLVLNDDNTFQFSYDILSSYLSYGNYTLKDKKLTCKTSDGKYVYVFDVVDDYTITFNEAESSEIHMTDSIYAKPKQGSVFHAEKKSSDSISLVISYIQQSDE